MKNLVTAFLIYFSVVNSNAQDLLPKDWKNLTGYWKFQNTKDLTRATVGNKLVLVGTHQAVTGPAYGDTAIRIGIGSYYKYPHSIAPNGGGDSVNRYTLMFDFKVLNFNRWHTFFQTDTTNKNDGECFIRPNSQTNPARIGTATTGYTPDPINANQWYRLVISVNLNNFYRYYLNGQLVLEGDTQEVDDRFALLPQILFFADNDKEDDTIDIASMAIFDTCLSSKDIATIGTIEPCVAYPPKINLGRDTTLCAGNSISLNAGADYLKYDWSTGDKMPFATVDAASLGLGRKLVWVNVVDRNGCKGNDTIAITFLGAPVVDLGNDTALCKGQNLELTAGKDLSYTYQWKRLPPGTVFSSKNKVTLDSGGTYTVSVISGFGCHGSDTIDIAIYNLPGKPIITSSGNTSFCSGDSVKLMGPSGYREYTWSNSSKLPEFYISKSITLRLKVKDGNNCESSFSDTVRVVVFQLPNAPFITVTGDTTFCEGDSVILSVPKTYKAFLWNDGPGSHSRDVKQTGWYFVSVIDSNNCTSTVSNNMNVRVKTRPAKPVINHVGKLNLCQGETVLLSAPGGFSAYVWNDSSKTESVVVQKTGTYRVKVQNTEACYSPWADPVNVEVTPIPSKPAVIVGSNDSLQSLLIATRYRWFHNGLQLSDTTRAIFPAKSGFYKVQTGNKNCWSLMSDSFYFKNLGIGPGGQILSKFVIYPNPVNTLAFMRLENTGGFREAFITVYDFVGNTILQDKASNSEMNAGKYLNMESMNKGMYFVKITAGSATLVVKLEKR